MANPKHGWWVLWIVDGVPKTSPRCTRKSAAFDLARDYQKRGIVDIDTKNVYLLDADGISMPLTRGVLYGRVAAMADFNRLWPKESDIAAAREGWAFFEADGVMTIMRIDDPETMRDDRELSFVPPTLESDAAALAIVATKAMAGSRLHALALYLDGRELAEDEELWVPPELLG